MMYVVLYTLIIICNAARVDLHHMASKLEGVFLKRDLSHTATDSIENYNLEMNELIENLAILEDQHQHVKDIPAFQQTPGFISFNVNPYLHLNGGYWENGGKTTNDRMLYRPSEKRGSNTLASFSSLNENMNTVFKRLYIHTDNKPTVISAYQMRKFPYSNIVRLSSGCTGTLLTPYHVITAAHCVHNGVDFKDNIEMLKIEVPDKIGYRIHYIVKINVPVMWLKTQTLPEVGRGAYDYAVVQLNLPAAGKQKFMQLALPTRKTLNTDFNFFGFFPEKSSGLWKSTCSAEENLIIMGGNIVLTECESALGNSGAAAFTENAVEGDKIIGILSNTIRTTSGQLETEAAEYEAIMLLTLPKCLDICTMIYPEGEKYDVCETVKKYHLQYVQIGSKRIMPFVG